MSEARELLGAVEELARLTGTRALRDYRSSIAVELKGDGSPVTAADRAAEEVAREWIMSRFPEDGIVGEEWGTHNPAAARRWILDPIDGTASFIRGVPLWGTLVAVARGDEVIAGAIHCPAVSELVCAADGEGCWLNGARARVSEIGDVAQATVLTTDDRFSRTLDRVAGWRKLSERALLSRGWSDCFGYLLVATGRAEAMVDPVMSAWDSAALLPVIREAGGVFTNWEGKVTGLGGSAIATNAALARETRVLLGAGTPERAEVAGARR